MQVTAMLPVCVTCVETSDVPDVVANVSDDVPIVQEAVICICTGKLPVTVDACAAAP